MHASPELGYSSRTLASIQQALEPLREWWLDPNVDEIQINGPNDVFVRSSGRDRKVSAKVSKSMIESAINLVASYNEKMIGEKAKHFLLSARLPGMRIEAMLPPVAIKGPSMCIRRHATRVVPLSEYVEKGICTQAQADLMNRIVKSDTNFMVSGGTYSGKTTLVNALLALIPPEQRIFTIEQVAELKLVAPNYASVECDPEQGVTAKRALVLAMRYSPHRIVLGELRGEEGWDFLMACNTGHPGSCTTIHADSAREALSRLEDLVRIGNPMPFDTLRTRIGKSIRWVIQIQMSEGQRRITEIYKVEGYDRPGDEYQFVDFSKGESGCLSESS